MPEILSGLLVVSLAIRLVWQRWIGFRDCQSSGYVNTLVTYLGEYHESDSLR